MNTEDRFLAKVFFDTINGCWLFTACWERGGYGHFQHGRAHRWAYEHFVGPIPEGLHIDHLCRVRCCVNPDHLEPVTPEENFRRGVRVMPQERCKSGRHLMADTRKNAGRRARCHPCELERHARYRAAARRSS